MVPRIKRKRRERTKEKKSKCGVCYSVLKNHVIIVIAMYCNHVYGTCLNASDDGVWDTKISQIAIVLGGYKMLNSATLELVRNLS